MIFTPDEYRTRWMTLFVATAVLLLGCMNATALCAQATTYLDPLDEVYADVDALVAGGLVDRTVVGQRPYSRYELAQLVIEARRTLVRRDSTDGRTAFLRGLVEAVADRICGNRSDALALADSSCLQPQTHLVRAASIDYTQTDSPTRLIPPSNGIGMIDATLNPLLSGRLGRPLDQGADVVLGTDHIYESRHVALALRPELVVGSDSLGRQRSLGRLQDAQLRVLVRNVAIDIGREYALWGQSVDGGLLGSTSGPPLDLIRVSNERLVTMPWFLRHLGPSKFSLFYSDLGPAQNFPHAYFIGYKISVTPSTNTELGFVVYTKSGGRGGPSANFGARLLDAFPFLNASFFAGVIGTRGAFQFSDRYAGLDGRWRFPALRSAELYGELLFNDFDVRRLGSVLWEDAGHVAGLYLPRLTDDGALSGRVEFHHTGIRYYEHHQFTSGQTLRGTLIGDELGPDALGGYGIVRWIATPRQRVELDGAWEQRKHDEYEILPLPIPQFKFRRTLERPREWRMRALVGWHFLPRPNGLGSFAQAGYERTHNFDFVDGADRNSVLGRVGLEYRFR